MAAMAILSLRITDFRNLAAAELSPCPQGLNIICGDNGSGKTSLLEAIHYLSIGRSFRSTSSSRLVRNSTPKFSLFAQLITNTERYVPIGVERDLNGTIRLRIAEQDSKSMLEIANMLPTRLINSQSHHLFESGPLFRRKYLDWGLFYQTEGFLSCWHHFERVLKQRNSVLRDQRSRKELDIWTEELIKYGLELDRLRREYVELLTPAISEIAMELLSLTNLEINYLSGWKPGMDYRSVLTNAYQEDYSQGYTEYGPHRADIDITVNAISVKHFLSRGQQKLLICAMILAQGMLLARHTNKGLVYLVDDLPSELDLRSRQKLISLLSRQNTQIFITAIEGETISDFLKGTEVTTRLFHVEHGYVTEKAGVIE